MTNLRDDCIERFDPHPVPEWVTRTCAEFGLSDSGLPKYRVVWNPSRVRVMNFPDVDTGGVKQRIVRKYPRLGDRWILETLVPWEIYGKWHEEAFGPKPADGEYCHTHTFQQTWEGEISVFNLGFEHVNNYLSLDDFGQDNLNLLITCIEKGKAVCAWQLRNYDEQLLAIEEKQWQEQYDDVYENHMSQLRDIEKAQEEASNRGQGRIFTNLDALPEIARRKDFKQIIH